MGKGEVNSVGHKNNSIDAQLDACIDLKRVLCQYFYDVDYGFDCIALESVRSGGQSRNGNFSIRELPLRQEERKCNLENSLVYQ